MALFSNNVWDRIHGRDEINDNTYNLIFSMPAVFGMCIYGILASMFLHAYFNFVGVLALLGVSIFGCFISKSDSPVIKLIGLSLIAGGLGVISGPFIGHFKMVSVINVAGATIIVTLFLGAIGIIYPKSLSNWGTTLLVLLVGLILMQIFAPIIYMAMGLPLKGLISLLDWVGVILFSTYIIYDFNRAQDLPKNVDNAMDCGISVFLDIANLFLRLLALFGGNSDD